MSNTAISPYTLAASANFLTATALSTGSWPAAIGTGIVSILTWNGSAGVFVSLTNSTLEKCSPAVYLVATPVGITALNTLALSAIMWTGLPIASLSLGAKVAITVLPIAVGIASMVMNDENSPLKQA